MTDTPIPSDPDPAYVLPLEAAKEHLLHWWREPVAGIVSLGVGVYDAWYFGHDAGLSSSLDELLIISGVVLIAGSRRLFGGAITAAFQRPPSNGVKP